MNLKIKNYVPLFLEGGEVTAEAPAEASPAEAAPTEEAPAGEDQMALIVQAFAQGLLNQDCLLLAQAALAFLEMVGGLPAPAEAPGAPVYRKGGRLSRWI